MRIIKEDSLLWTAVKRCLWMVVLLCSAFLMICPETPWAATYTVTSTADSGAGSLRQAITSANALPGSTISFNIATAANQSSGGDSWWRITTASALPSITADNTVIDGSTQGTTNSKGPEIEIFGNGISASGLSVSGATGVTIEDIVINSFAGSIANGSGIYINNATNTTVTGCYIGTNATASAALGNSNHGIQIIGTSSGTVIGGASAGAGNIISGSSGQNGIYLGDTSTGAVIKGNKIGTGYTGTENLANLQGIYVNTSAAATNNIIGGVNAGEGNVIANSLDEGILMISDGTGDKILGNTVRNGGAGGTAGIYSNVPGGYIAKNTIYSYNGPGIFLTATANNGKIYQNTIHGCSGVAVLITGPTGAVIKNNLLTNNSSWGINANVAITTGNNDYFNNAAGTCTATSGCPGAGSINADPLYVNAAGGDFHLTECTSPAINQGIDLVADQPDMNGATAGLWNNNAPEMGAFETTGSCAPSLAIVKQAWDLNGTVPLTSLTAPVGYTIVFLIYVKNTTAGPVTDLRVNDNLDETAFQYESGSLVRTTFVSPPADTATDKQIFDATDPGTGTVLSDALDGDVSSALDTGPPAGVDRITIGAVTGQANGSLTISAHTTFALRFKVKIK